jgi:hypothetical protein
MVTRPTTHPSDEPSAHLDCCSRRALTLAALRTSQPAPDILKPGVPPAQICQALWEGAAVVTGRRARQDKFVLP